MNQEKNSSPFAALSYQEQQDRWLEWRSRELDYHPAPENPQEETERKEEKTTAASAFSQRQEPPQLPFIRNPAPTRHRELDRLLAKHTQAARKAGPFYSASITETIR